MTAPAERVTPARVADLVERAIERGHSVTVRLEDLDRFPASAGAAGDPVALLAPTPAPSFDRYGVLEELEELERRERPPAPSLAIVASSARVLAHAAAFYVLAGGAWALGAVLDLVDRAGSRRTRDRQGGR